MTLQSIELSEGSLGARDSHYIYRHYISCPRCHPRCHPFVTPQLQSIQIILQSQFAICYKWGDVINNHQQKSGHWRWQHGAGRINTDQEQQRSKERALIGAPQSLQEHTVGCHTMWYHSLHSASEECGCPIQYGTLNTIIFQLSKETFVWYGTYQTPWRSPPNLTKATSSLSFNFKILLGLIFFQQKMAHPCHFFFFFTRSAHSYICLSHCSYQVTGHVREISDQPQPGYRALASVLESIKDSDSYTRVSVGIVLTVPHFATLLRVLDSENSAFEQTNCWMSLILQGSITVQLTKQRLY